jgi:hypothetical protein
MSPAASTWIALASLALAALTVFFNYLNVRRQAEAAMRAEHVKWLRDKRDDLYGRMIAAVDVEIWHSEKGLRETPEEYDQRVSDRRKELEEVINLALRFASDAVLQDIEELADVLLDESLSETQQAMETFFGTTLEDGPRASLIRHIREEMVGHDEAEKTWRRLGARPGPWGDPP